MAIARAYSYVGPSAVNPWLDEGATSQAAYTVSVVPRGTEYLTDAWLKLPPALNSRYVRPRLRSRSFPPERLDTVGVRRMRVSRDDDLVASASSRRKLTSESIPGIRAANDSCR
jgi:hypothetical protein